MIMPTTFVSDCTIENYTVASEKDQSVKHEQTTCVPIAFINDSMISLVKTQETMEDDCYFETESFKQPDLTPGKQGYTPEKHPTKKPRSWKSITTIFEMNDMCTTGWADENISIKEPKSKSFKEMTGAINQSTITISSDSDDGDDDFDDAYKPLDNRGLYFSARDEPAEGEKQSMQAKGFLSDSFDYSHDFQMVSMLELWEYKEFESSLMRQSGNNPDHLEQVRRFILKNCRINCCTNRTQLNINLPGKSCNSRESTYRHAFCVYTSQVAHHKKL